MTSIFNCMKCFSRARRARELAARFWSRGQEASRAWGLDAHQVEAQDPENPPVRNAEAPAVVITHAPETGYHLKAETVHDAVEIFHDIVKDIEPVEDVEPVEIFPFLSLPAEVRHEVYKQLAEQSQNYKLRKQRRHQQAYGGPHPVPRRWVVPSFLKLMLTSHQLYDEIHALLPSITTFHVTNKDALSPKVITNEGPTLTLTLPALWHVHPLFRRASFVTGRWSHPFTNEEQYPSIRLAVLEENPFRWRRVEMVVDVFVSKVLKEGTKEVEGRFMDWLKNALVQTRWSCVSIDEYVRFGVRGGLRVSVLLRVHDRNRGCRVGKAVLEGGNVTVVMERGAAAVNVGADEFRAVFCEVFDVDGFDFRHAFRDSG